MADAVKLTSITVVMTSTAARLFVALKNIVRIGYPVGEVRDVSSGPMV